MTFNQNFQNGWNTLFTNLQLRIGEDLIKRVEFTSPFSRFIQNLELGNYVQETYINPAEVYLHDTVTNSDILTNHVDTILTTVHDVNVDLNIPSTYKEFLVRKSYNFWDNVNNLIAGLVANIRVTSEIAKNNIVKQMLFNAYQYGMIDATVVDDPRLGRDEGAQFIATINASIDDFLTEPNARGLIYNNQEPTPTVPAIGIATQIPYVITFNDFLRHVETFNTIELAFGKYAANTGNENYDFSRRFIPLNFEDFPSTIPSTNRSEVTGTNVSAKDINFFEMPTDTEGNDLFSNTPQAGTTAIAYILEPTALVMRTQLDVTTNFQNTATLATTNRLILRLVISLSGFDKIKAIAIN